MKNIMIALIVTTCIVVVITALSFQLIDLAIGECIIKDPHDFVLGWQDSVVEFGQSYKVLMFHTVEGKSFYFFNTSPGWYRTPDLSYIDYVVMCR